MKQEIEIPVGFIATQKAVYCKGATIVVTFNLEKLKPVFKLGDVLCDGWNTWIHKKYDGGIKTFSIPVINLSGGILTGGDIFITSHTHIANYEERCKFFEALVKAGYKWNSNKLELSKPEPKIKTGDIIVVERTGNDLPGKCKLIMWYVSGKIGGGRINVCGVLSPVNFQCISLFNSGCYDKIRLANTDERREYLDAAYRAGCLQFR